MKYACITLLLAFLLVAMPVVAMDPVSMNDHELRLIETETKNIVGEEVVRTLTHENMTIELVELSMCCESSNRYVVYTDDSSIYYTVDREICERGRLLNAVLI